MYIHTCTYIHKTIDIHCIRIVGDVKKADKEDGELLIYSVIVHYVHLMVLVEV